MPFVLFVRKMKLLNIYFGTVRLYKLLLMKLILGYCQMVLVFHLLCNFVFLVILQNCLEEMLSTSFLLQIKQYIFNCKYFQKKLSLVTMQRKIQSLYNIEKSIAIKNKKMDFFSTRYGMLSLYCLIRYKDLYKYSFCI